LRLPKAFADEIVAHALEEEPNEACGLLAGKGERVVKLYRVTNTEQSPSRYNMEPQELYHAYRDMEDNGWDLLGIYHSHPKGQAYPSDTDVELAFWPEALYIIVSLLDRERPTMRAFRITEHLPSVFVRFLRWVLGFFRLRFADKEISEAQIEVVD